MPQFSSAMDQSVSPTLSQVGSSVVVTTPRQTRRTMEITQVLSYVRDDERSWAWDTYKKPRQKIEKTRIF